MSEQDANGKAIRLERVDLDFRSKPEVAERLERAFAPACGRITTADAEDNICGYVGHGELTNDQLDTFSNCAVAEVPNLQNVLRHDCKKGFEHHVVMTQLRSAEICAEVFGKYFGWEIFCCE